METKIKLVVSLFVYLFVAIGIIGCTNIQRHFSQVNKLPENLEECTDKLMHELASN